MPPLIYTNPVATFIFIVACLIWLLPEMIGMYRQMAIVSRKSAVVQDRGSLVILIGLQWVGIVLNFLLALLFTSATIPWHRTAIFLLGIIFMMLGVALRWFAIWKLGRYFTRDVAVSSHQEVVQSGPYHFIRHPAYTGTFLTMLGLGLAMTNWASLIALLLCVFLGHFNRVKIEEEALIHNIGQPYIEYMQHTKRFIPLVF
ncbi:MAG: isoprenylcysteine carboxylmethyltransferase family protein [Anaerolineales bacterium]